MPISGGRKRAAAGKTNTKMCIISGSYRGVMFYLFVCWNLFVARNDEHRFIPLSPSYLQYNSIDTSYLSRYVMHPFWDWCVKVGQPEKNVMTQPASNKSRHFIAFPPVGRAQPPNLLRFHAHRFQLSPYCVLRLRLHSSHADV